MTVGPAPPRPDPALLAAYRAAEYVVPIGSRVCRLRIGQPVPESMQQWLAARGGAGWISACNPGSRPLTLLENLRRHQDLFRCLQAEGFDALVGYATDPAGQWPDETSLLVPDIALERLNRLALDFGQVAFLWLERAQPPRMWLADPGDPLPDPLAPPPSR
ncbi:hypothetical protein TVNIR_0139 [Thioalkalivibrio nitratireducens DSM 14787]|uniref:DUF3293 domain-containing protein n=1 Tax=Thioalkalivibrio nitratireducens (strain DSM 14787 / UNIQEM 213 / ALEN2) TaxID=1255043 RepID=L0DS86_THIND|nr:DUF3293 domain-containing protein [Thioalkalivibrio nitratireducens]AGA31852.1 hypothetical protein TVNIR_0139 [Thioalkalivibrio nitratireducens DSM 14787]